MYCVVVISLAFLRFAEMASVCIESDNCLGDTDCVAITTTVTIEHE